MFVSDVMSTEVITVTADTPAPAVARLLVERMITGVPVVDAEGHPMGVVSRSDLLRYATSPQPYRGLGDFYRELWAEKEEIVALSDSVKVCDLMNANVLSVVEHAPVKEVAEMMLHHRVHRVVVTRHRKVVGLVTTTDLVRHLLTFLPAEVAK